MKFSCIMLTRDRVPMAAKAFAAWKRQTVESELVILDTSERPTICSGDNIVYSHRPDWRDRTIGALRNLANEMASGDVLVHWDDDDISGPERLFYHQIAFQCAPATILHGFYDMHFYDQRDGRVWLYSSRSTGYVIGTSMAYRREFWRANPFPNLNRGEDKAMLDAVMKSGRVAVDSETSIIIDKPPIMAARMHAGNTEQKKPHLGHEYWSAVTDERQIEMVRGMFV